jgi:2-amino-4-hydroxy-6-hydroxymethyldihydropteridine diphosphokinase|tara:strand:- start:173 stop:679 length:507 start_codon:yes stop_codon:yes gene_type:complete
MDNLVYLSIGSNLGNREANLAAAISAFGTHKEISKIRSASFYESPYLGAEEQPEYLNTVVEFITSLGPFDLFDRTCQIEQMMGRPRKREKNIARSLDIDILCHGDSVLETKTLVIPHPRLPIRKFVLIPFYELAPDFIIPGLNVSVENLLHICPDTSVVTKHNLESRA